MSDAPVVKHVVAGTGIHCLQVGSTRGYWVSEAELAFHPEGYLAYTPLHLNSILTVLGLWTPIVHLRPPHYGWVNLKEMTFGSLDVLLVAPRPGETSLTQREVLSCLRKRVFEWEDGVPLHPVLHQQSLAMDQA